MLVHINISGPHGYRYKTGAVSSTSSYHAMRIRHSLVDQSYDTSIVYLVVSDERQNGPTDKEARICMCLFTQPHPEPFEIATVTTTIVNMIVVGNRIRINQVRDQHGQWKCWQHEQLSSKWPGPGIMLVATMIVWQ
jgi:hypothetical protein